MKRELGEERLTKSQPQQQSDIMKNDKYKKSLVNKRNALTLPTPSPLTHTQTTVNSGDGRDAEDLPNYSTM